MGVGRNGNLLLQLGKHSVADKHQKSESHVPSPLRALRSRSRWSDQVVKMSEERGNCLELCQGLGYSEKY